MYYLASTPQPSSAAIAEAVALATAHMPVKKHMKWKAQQANAGSMPCLTLPTVHAEDDCYMDSRLCLSPNLPGLSETGAQTLMTPAVHPAAYGFMACSPVILERLGPHILRSHISTTQHKAIPHNDRVDLEAFRRKDPQEWNMDDVIGWMIAVAKKHQIPVEDMNMHRFANCTGPLLALMTQQNFIDRDNAYGYLLYREFRKLLGDEPYFLDDWMRQYKEDMNAAMTSGMAAMVAAAGASSVLSTLADAAAASSSDICSKTSDQPCTSAQAEADGASAVLQRATVIKAAGSSAPRSANASSSSSQQSTNALQKMLPSKIKSESVNQRDDMHFTASSNMLDSTTASASACSTMPKFANGKIKKNKSGDCMLLSSSAGLSTVGIKPRKRSQHTKGNKLWEFIRDALKDPETCPTVVRWEDQNEGVFRIVESERLARLWGEKKNNQKMTYEKLSRAMRYYYNTKILLPVSGRRLVYKFGPNAADWKFPRDSSCSSSSSTAEPNCASEVWGLTLAAGDDRLCRHHEQTGSSPCYPSAGSSPSDQTVDGCRGDCVDEASDIETADNEFGRNAPIV